MEEDRKNIKPNVAAYFIQNVKPFFSGERVKYLNEDADQTDALNDYDRQTGSEVSTGFHRHYPD